MFHGYVYCLLDDCKNVFYIGKTFLNPQVRFDRHRIQSKYLPYGLYKHIRDADLKDVMTFEILETIENDDFNEMKKELNAAEYRRIAEYRDLEKDLKNTYKIKNIY